MIIDKKTSDMIKKEYLKLIKNTGFVNNRIGTLMSLLDTSIKRANMKLLIEEMPAKEKDDSMTTKVIRKCKTCGKEFETYQYWKIANCPEHRQVQWKDISLDSD